MDNHSCWTPLAVVGAACRLPGSRNLQEFWDLICSGGDATGELPDSVLNRELYFDPQPGKRGKSYSVMGGLVPQLPFDNSKCRLSAQDIANSDVAHLTMCEVTSDAFRDANYDPFDLPQRNAGVYFGHTGGSAIAGELMYAVGVEQTAQYLHEIPELQALPKSQREEIIRDIVESTRRDFDFRRQYPNRKISPVAGCELIARAFGLQGPCLVVDAACASSLQALAIAARALAQNRIDMAVVGGASCCKGDSLVLFSAAHSVTAGKSRPFDEGANGLVTAEGYVTLILKRLDDAVAAGDRIRGVIRGLGVSSDGKGKSLWAPLKEGQELAIQRAYDERVRPTDIQFMEAHATSTQVGDATELAALAKAFPAVSDESKKIPLGSVKANIGHTLETAGLAGLLKTLLAMEQGTIPPCANLQQPNTAIAWRELPFSLPLEARHWDRRGSRTRKAAVNAFGIGGLNVHVVLEEYLADMPTGYYGPASIPVVAAPTPEPVAVIGLGAILPGAHSVDEFWQLLKSGRDPKTQVSPERWNSELCYDPSQPQAYRSTSRLGGFCSDYRYDWRKHRVPPKQIAAANPLQFMLLDAADQALSSSGILKKQLTTERAGVIVGTNFGGDFSDGLQMGLKLPDFRKRLSALLSQHGWESQAIHSVCERYEEILLSKMPALIDETGSFTSSTLASRITKTFNLKGGALALDAGVGTGLAALSAAVDVLRSGDCDIMICAAGQRNMDLQAFESASRAGFLASGQPSPAFTQTDGGYALGEGCAVMVLKRLSDAQRDGDPIVSVIHDVAAATNWSMPGDAFALATQRALEASRVRAAEILSVEASDLLPAVAQAEVQPVGRLLASPVRQRELCFASIVSQFGFMGATHSLAAALKACMAIRHAELPSAGTSETLRAGLFPEGTTAQQQSIPIDPSSTSVISVLGGSDLGTCYHALIGTEASAVVRERRSPQAKTDHEPPSILRFGGRTWEEVRQQVEQSLDISAATQPFTSEARKRLAVVCASQAEWSPLQAQLLAAEFTLGDDQREAWSARGVFWGEHQTAGAQCAFVFPGHSSQYPGMFADAIEHLPAASMARVQADAALKSLGLPDFDFFAGAQSTGLGTDLWKTQAGILLGTWVSYQTLIQLGLEPAVTMGHSFGEYMALVAAGTLSLTDAIRAAKLRAEAISSVPELDGVMAATGADHQTIAELVNNIPGVYLANFNSPRQTVISGTRTAIQQALEQLRERRVSSALLAVPAPFHSPLLAPAADTLAVRLRELPLRRAQIPVVSTAGLGLMRSPSQIMESLSSQLVTPVDFPSMLQQLLACGIKMVVEVGPKQVLTRLCRNNQPHCGVVFMASDHPKRGQGLSLLDVVAQADCLGCLQSAPTPASRQPSSRSSKHAPRVLTFDATVKRRQRMRSQSSQNGHTHSVGQPVAERRKSEQREKVGATHRNGAKHAKSASLSQGTLAAKETAAAKSLAPKSSTSHALVDTVATALPIAAVAAEPKITQAVASKIVPNTAELKDILVAFVVEQTGYPEDMIEVDADLEADLGIDSIKKAQLFGEVGMRFEIAPRDDLSLDDFTTLQHVLDFLVGELAARGGISNESNSVVQVPTPPANAPAQSTAELANVHEIAANRPQLNVAALKDVLVQFVVEQTGYPEDMIEVDADLEADLGIDSIKKAQLFGEVGMRFDIAPRDDLSLDDFTTLQHVLNFLVEELRSRGSGHHVQETESLTGEAMLIQSEVDATLKEAPYASATAPAIAELRSDKDIDEAHLRRVLVEFVVDQTGYPEDMIELDADLEAELGIDSIKKAQLFGEIGASFDIAPREDLSLDDFSTLRHVLDFLLRELAETDELHSHKDDGRLGEATHTSGHLPAPQIIPSPEQIRNTSAESEWQTALATFARVIELVGPGASKGQAHGQAMRAEIQQNLKRLTRENLGLRKTDVQWSDEFHDELSSLAIAAHVNREALLAWNAVDRSDSFRIGFTEANPCVLRDGVAAVVQLRQAESGLKYMTLSHAGQLTIPFGVNSARVAVSCAPLQAEIEAREWTALAQALHQLLARCQSASQALAFLSSVRMNSRWSIGLSDLSDAAPEYWVLADGGLEPGQARSAQVDFHTACRLTPECLRIYDRQTQAEMLLNLEELLPKSTSNPSPQPAEPPPGSFRRHVLRMVACDLNLPAATTFSPGDAIGIIGKGLIAHAVREHLATHGIAVELISPHKWREGYKEYLDSYRPLHLIVVDSPAQTLDACQPSQHLSELFSGFQQWIAQLEESDAVPHATLVAITQLGGDFGFASDCPGFLGGALTGLFKGIRREYPSLRAKVIDFDGSATPSKVADQVFGELCSDCRELEVGYRDGKRFLVGVFPESSLPQRLPPQSGKAWIITGGGRGVTAAVARELGKTYGVHLHLLGTVPLPDSNAIWRGLDETGMKALRKQLALQAREQGRQPDQLWKPVEKAIELERNLQALVQAGIVAHYHCCDITDRSALRSVLASIRAADGPIQGIVHGAGIEAACRFSRKQPENVRKTIAAKCDGAANLMALTREDPLTTFVGFGSTSGRFGGLGQADYSLASDLLAKMIDRLAEERPHCKAVCMHWPAWDEVGMAARPESRMALERGGLSFMPLKVGVSHFMAELLAEGNEREILILDKAGLLDTDGTMGRKNAGSSPASFRPRGVTSENPSAMNPATAMAPAHLAACSSSGSPPTSMQLVSAVRPGKGPDEYLASFVLRPKLDPFLLQHQLRGKPILPAVMSLQAFAEAAQPLWANHELIGFSKVSWGSGLSVSADQFQAEIRMRLGDQAVHCELIGPFANSQGKLIEERRVYATATVEFGSPQALPTVPKTQPLFGWSPFVYPTVTPIVHGPALQTFKSLAFRHAGGIAQIEGRDPQQLLGDRQLQGRPLPLAELDGCLVAVGFFTFAMVEQSFNLPHAIDRLRLGVGAAGNLRGANEQQQLSFDYLGKTELGHRFDMLLVDQAGRSILEIKGYQTVGLKE